MPPGNLGHMGKNAVVGGRKKCKTGKYRTFVEPKCQNKCEDVGKRTLFLGPRDMKRINLAGTLWSITVQDYDTYKAGKLTIVTECEYFAQDGCKTIETTWHHVTAWESEEVKNLEQQEVGSTVHIVGRLRVRQRRKATGEYVTVHDIIASMVETL